MKLTEKTVWTVAAIVGPTLVVVLVLAVVLFVRKNKRNKKSASMKTTSQRGIDLIKEFEGLRLNAYQCSASKWTIGYGHTEGVQPTDRIDEKQAEQFLRDDLAKFEQAINDENLTISQNQFDALVSLTFNIGITAFKKSTVLKLAKANPDDPEIRKAFGRFKLVNNTESAGLVRRRAAEADLYFGK